MDDSDEPTPPPPPRPPVVLAGSGGYAKLRLAAALSREEVLRRRRRRLMQLYSLYRSQFWALADELPAKHGDYWWDHGASPVVEPPPHALPPPEDGGGDAASITHGAAGGTVAFSASNYALPPPSEKGVGSAVTPVAPGVRAACSASNCGAKAMPLTSYCFDHILLDPKQQLYKHCTFVTKQSSTPNGEEICGKPVLRGITPLWCSDHDPKAQKHIIEALKNAGIDLPLTKDGHAPVYISGVKVRFIIKKEKNDEPENFLDVMLQCRKCCREEYCATLCNWLLVGYPLQSLKGRKQMWSLSTPTVTREIHKRNFKESEGCVLSWIRSGHPDGWKKSCCSLFSLHRFGECSAWMFVDLCAVIAQHYILLCNCSSKFLLVVLTLFIHIVVNCGGDYGFVIFMVGTWECI